MQAIVIKSSQRKEKDASVLLFSLESGKVWATLKGVKNPKAKMKTAQSQFAYGEFVLEEGKSGKIVTSFEMIENFHELCEDVDKFFEASAVLGALDKLDFSSTQERARAFVLTLKTLKGICFGQVKKNYCLSKFLIELFKICGFGLFSVKCSCCGMKSVERFFVDYAIGELVCAGCKTFACEEMPKTAYMALKLLDATDFEKLGTLRLSAGSELALLHVLVKDFEAHFDCKLNLIGIFI